jgi:hypothetical protein
MMARKVGRPVTIAAIAGSAVLVASCAIRLRGGDDATIMSRSEAQESAPAMPSSVRCNVLLGRSNQGAPDCQRVQPGNANAAPKLSGENGMGGAVRKDEGRLPSGYPFARTQSE